MRYSVKQRLLSVGSDFSIKDENGVEAYYIDGKVFTFGKKFVVRDRNKNDIALIRQRLLTFRPTYTITRKGRELAKVFKRLTSFRNTFMIDVPGPDDITVIGRWIEHEYKFYRNKKEVATVSKKYFRARDTYGVEILNEADTLLILATSVVIDTICHPKRDSSFK